MGKFDLFIPDDANNQFGIFWRHTQATPQHGKGVWLCKLEFPEENFHGIDKDFLRNRMMAAMEDLIDLLNHDYQEIINQEIANEKHK